MTNTNTIVVHSGLRPGELIIGHSDGSDTVFLPPLNYAYRFTIVKNSDMAEWAISRTQLSNGTIEALLKFTSLEAAEKALAELHQALLEPATEPAPAPSEREREIKPTDVFSKTGKRFIIIATAIVIGVILFYMSSRSDEESNEVIETTQSIPTPVSNVEAEPYISPTAPPAPMPASPGEALLLQIGGGSQAPGPSQPSPVQQPLTPQAPPATPGDGLLQQIQGR